MAPPAAWNAVVGSHGEEGSRRRRARHRRDRGRGVVGRVPPEALGVGGCCRHPGDRVPPPSLKGPRSQGSPVACRIASTFRSNSSRTRYRFPFRDRSNKGSRATPAPRSSSAWWTAGASRTGRVGYPDRSPRSAPRRLPRSTTASRRRHQQMPSAPGCWRSQAGRFQHPPDGLHYDAPTDCRIDDPHGFDGAPPYLCAISVVAQGPAPWLSRT